VDTFTKMMDAALKQELIKWDNPKVGDWTDKGVIIASIKRYSVEDGFVFETNKSRGRVETKDKFIYLPTIEQLMGMVLSRPYLNFPGRHSLKLGQMLNDVPWAVNFNSPKELWLAFVMHEKFSMTWSGSKWEKI